MRRSSLVLMEQVLMLLVFSVAAAFCVQSFALSRDMSRQAAVLDQALTQAQNAAELLKSSGGTAGEGLELLCAALGGNRQGDSWQWEQALTEEGTGTYTLEASAAPEDGPSQVTIRCLDEAGEVLFSLPVAWQAGERHG